MQNLRRVRTAFKQLEMTPEFVVAVRADEMEARVRAALADGTRLVFAMGGDGTVQAVVNAVGVEQAGRSDENGVVIGILPSGGGNDFASALRLPLDSAKAVAGLSRSTVRAIDVLRARTEDGAARLYVGGGGVGLDVDAARHASDSYRRWPGRSRYLASALHAWREFQPLVVRVEFPDDDLRAIDARVMLAAALNTPSYGAGMRIAPDASIEDGLLDVSILRSLTVGEVSRAIPGLFAKGRLPNNYFVRKKAHSVILRTERPSLFHADGEIIGPAPVRIDVLPGAVRFLAPISARIES